MEKLGEKMGTLIVLAEYYQVFEYERLKHLSRVRVARFRGLLEKTAIKVKTGGRLKISEHEEECPFGKGAQGPQDLGNEPRQARF